MRFALDDPIGDSRKRFVKEGIRASADRESELGLHDDPIGRGNRPLLVVIPKTNRATFVEWGGFEEDFDRSSAEAMLDPKL